MRLSVIIPVYNAAPYLAECLESILTQLPMDAEVICVDDGSTDNSAAILESFARREVRIKILHQNNAGQSAARNHGLQQAQGDFIYFADADDALTGAYSFSQLIEEMTRDNLDVLFFDAVTKFDTPELATSSSIRPKWYIRTHQYPFVYTGPQLFAQFIENHEFTVLCQLMFLRRTFLSANNLRFLEGIFHEDNIFALHTILSAQRASHRAWKFYLRKVHSDSTMTRKPTVRHLRGRIANYQDVVDLLQQKKWSKDVRAALYDRLKLYLKRLRNVLPELLPEYETQLTATERQIAHQVLLSIPKKPSSRAKPRTFIGRMFKCFRDEGFWYTLKRMVVLGKKDPKKLPRDERVQMIVRQVEKARQKTTPNLYLVTPPLHSLESEAIDSWTFFSWLQANHIPSRYLVPRCHSRYARIVQDGCTKDVIALDGNGIDDDEILFEHSDLLIRAKAIVQEDFGLNQTLWKWLVHLPNCERVLLQHGVVFWKLSEGILGCFGRFNSANVSSLREKELLERFVPINSKGGERPRYLVAGLPRFDLLKDEREPNRSEFVLFVMFTWRRTFAKQPELIKESAYSRHIRSLLSPENIARLKRSHVRVVVALHNAFATRGYAFSFCENVEMVSSTQISYWIRHADACLTDYSSVAFDFAFLHKPTIYWVPDAGDPMLNESDRGEIEIAQRQAKDFYNVETSEEGALKLIEFYAQRNFVLEPEKCAISDTFFAYRKDVCQHVYEGIEEIIKGRQVNRSRKGGS